MNNIVIEICVGTSCYLLGAQDLIRAVEELPCEQRSHIELRGVTCLKTCGKGPNVRIDGVVVAGMTPERLLTIIQDKLG